MFLTNVFHIVKVNIKEIGNSTTDSPEIYRKVWGTITLGSDYDGIVDPFDSYDDSGDFKKFKADVINYLNTYDSEENEGFKIIDVYNGGHIGNEEYITTENMKSLLFDFSVEEIAEKIFYGNMREFLRKYFKNDYLQSGNI